MDNASKELLEKAAHNSSIEVYWQTKYDAGLTDEFLIDHPRPHFVIKKYPYKEWNPLVSDEDAFDLMVKERLLVDITKDYVKVVTDGYGCFFEYCVNHETAKAAVRFCIVRAVASKE